MSIHPTRMPLAVYANENGEIRESGRLTLSGRSGRASVIPELSDLIPLPDGSDFFVLPGRLPVGRDKRGNRVIIDAPAGKKALAVAAFMAPAHTATLICDFEKMDDAPTLPLFAYSALGWGDGRFWVAGFRSDDDRRQKPGRYHPDRIKKNTATALRNNKNNRLIQHLGKCCLTYNCPAAVNYFMGRFEAPLPTSPTCNAQCLGCISLQPSGCCPSTQERLAFTPSPDEIAEIAVAHLEKTGHVASFGQGCEGEPLMAADTIEAAIKKIRKATDQGTINLNSNSSRPREVARLSAAGLDSIRVSINSARDQCHAGYYRPRDFSLTEIKESIRVMKNDKKFVSLNYFILPGFTDTEAEYAALSELVSDCDPDFIQLRNLNIDPDWYLDEIAPEENGPGMGIRRWLTRLKTEFPQLGFGYFNPPLQGKAEGGGNRQGSRVGGAGGQKPSKDLGLLDLSNL